MEPDGYQANEPDNNEKNQTTGDREASKQILLTDQTEHVQPATLLPTQELPIVAVANQTPAINPQPISSSPSAVDNSHNSAGIIVLQWLVYAFWGWTALSLGFLTISTIASYVEQSDTGTFTTYMLAAVLVLLPISFVCDLFYAKHEPDKKTGPSIIVMVIHAVLFALFGIGAVITAMFSVVQLMISSTGSSTTQVALYSAVIMSIVYGALFLRTLNPTRAPWIRRFFPIFMVVVVGTISILGIAGPVVGERARRTDRLIENNVSSLVERVNRYSQEKKTLPENLSQLNADGDVKKLVDLNVIKYTPNTKPASKQSNTNRVGVYDASGYLGANQTTYFYTVCVTYQKKTKNQPNYNVADYNADSDGYSSYVTVYNHESGDVCYKLKTQEI